MNFKVSVVSEHLLVVIVYVIIYLEIKNLIYSKSKPIDVYFIGLRR